MKVALYSRYSTDRQNESSIADQVRVCSEYAQRQDWQVVERFTDEGISGAAVGNRPGVLKLQECRICASRRCGAGDRSVAAVSLDR